MDGLTLGHGRDVAGAGVEEGVGAGAGIGIGVAAAAAAGTGMATGAVIGPGAGAGPQRPAYAYWLGHPSDPMSSRPPTGQQHRPATWSTQSYEQPRPHNGPYTLTPPRLVHEKPVEFHAISPDKPLPRLPAPPPLPARPHSDPPRVCTPPKSFKASPYLIIPGRPPHRPASDSVIPTISTPPRSTRDGPSVSTHPEIIDLTLDSPSSASAGSPSSPTHFTPRSPARIRRRAISDQPPGLRRAVLADASTTTNASPGRGRGSPARRPPAGAGACAASGDAVQCSGYTRSGERCKRLVKVGAPYLSTLPHIRTPSKAGAGKAGSGGGVVEDEDEGGGRYCKDHAGMICQAEGFYCRDKPGLWIAFDGELAIQRPADL